MQSLSSDQLNVLVIEDNPADLFLIEQMLLLSNGKIQHIYTADRISAGIELLNQFDINIVLLDLSLPDSFGFDSFLSIKRSAKKIPVIILTGLSDTEMALEAIKAGAKDYLVKGEFKTDILVKSIQYSIERKNAEEKILASEEKYRQMFYKNPFPAWIYDIDSFKILEVNDTAIQKYGYQRAEFLNLVVQDIYLEESKSQVTEFTEEIELSGIEIWKHKKSDGNIILVEATWYEIDYFGVAAMQVQINDVTEKVKLQEELNHQQKLKQQQITDAVLSALEKERKNIGEELHDNINQILATSRMFINIALRNPVPDFQLVSQSNDYIMLAMDEIRKLSKVLITPAFVDGGLKQSIDTLVRNILVGKSMEISTNLTTLDEGKLSDNLKLTLYRIIQEQVNNILKHADASEIIINIQVNNDIVTLNVQDNGKGFDPLAQRNGVGITNINSRAELFSGKVKIESAPGNGCLLVVTLFTKVTGHKEPHKYQYFA
ncbi:histidine kinase dimerization/phosphoacceptor domain -containing protein [soil metagenome]